MHSYSCEIIRKYETKKLNENSAKKVQPCICGLPLPGNVKLKLPSRPDTTQGHE
jgi:hypothetical protein